jgi:two-component system, response regulator RegA
VTYDFESSSLLLVDDDPAFRNRLAHALRKRHIEVWTAENAEQALQRAQLESPEFAIVDLRMPGQSGLALVETLHALDPDIRILVLTAYGSIATALDAIRLGATNFLQKPASVDEILLAFSAGDRLSARGIAEPPSQVPTLARAEWELINRVLSECQGNVCRAAKLLGVHRRTLQRKLSKIPLEG